MSTELSYTSAKWQQSCVSCIPKSVIRRLYVILTRQPSIQKSLTWNVVSPHFEWQNHLSYNTGHSVLERWSMNQDHFFSSCSQTLGAGWVAVILLIGSGMRVDTRALHTPTACPWLIQPARWVRKAVAFHSHISKHNPVTNPFSEWLWDTHMNMETDQV